MSIPPFTGLGGLAWGVLCPYGSLNLTAGDEAQTFEEPLDLGEVKSFLNLPDRSPADPEEDTTLGAMISAAREVAEILQNRDLVEKQWDLSLDYFITYQIILRDPLASVDLVQYTDKDGTQHTLAENTDYLVDKSKHPGRILPAWNTTWPAFWARPSSAVLVRFTSGLSSTDAFWNEAGGRIKLGMKMLISAWFNNRLPFGAPISEFPYYITSLLGFGAVERAH